MTVRIVGLERSESGKLRVMFFVIVSFDKSAADVILNYLYDVYERNIDIQVRFKWTPYASGELLM